MCEIPAAAWNACANPTDEPFDPFLTHAFLDALETSGSAVAKTGWQPFHLLIERNGELVGAAPMYLKSHSRGEYVFDSGWADAFERAGGRYYPKLQLSVPFTPVTGRRILTRTADPTLAAAVASGCVNLTEQLDVSSLHVTFPTEPQWQLLGELGLLKRIDQQFHWRNRGYTTFDDFLSALSSKKRKNVKRERREAVQSGIDIEWVTGNDLTERHWDAFFDFYMDTGSRKWGSPYLKRAFFSQIGESMAEHVLLILCRRAGRYIAGALNFIGSHALYGRNWGCIEDHAFLHFETCYYQAIEFAISRGLERVEAGAQGGHKVARGYEPTTTYSAHWIRHAGLRQAIARFLSDESRYVEQDQAFIRERLPFKVGNPAAGESSRGVDRGQGHSHNE